MKILYFPQTKPFWCGPAAVQMLLAYYGIHQAQGELAQVLKTTLKEGTTLSNIQNYLQTLAFQSHYKIFENQELALSSLKARIENESPVITLLNRLIYDQETSLMNESVDWESDTFSNHFVVVNAVNEHQIFFKDPHKLMGAMSLPIETFLEAWFSAKGPGEMLWVLPSKN